MIETLNRLVAAKPFVQTSPTASSLKNGIAYIDQKIKLTSLDVLVAARIQQGEQFFLLEVGDKIWVKADNYVLPWAKQPYEMGDITFILVPQDAIVMVERGCGKCDRPAPLSSARPEGTSQ